MMFLKTKSTEPQKKEPFRIKVMRNLREELDFQNKITKISKACWEPKSSRN